MNAVWNQDFNPYKHLETWRNPEDLAKDREYDEKANTTPEDTKEVQEKAREGLFWEFKNPENEWLKTENKEEKEIDLSSDSPYFPILEELYLSWEIKKEEFMEALSKLNSTNSVEENRADFLDLVNFISNWSLKASILESFTDEKEITEADFKQTEFFKEVWSFINLDKWIWWLEITLAKNYVSFTDIDWASNHAKNLSVCIDTTLNSIISKNSINFRKENWELISDIRKETNLNTKYNLLKKLYKKDLIDDAKKWWKKYREEIRQKKESLKEELRKLARERIEAQKIQNEQEKTKKITEINLQIQQIITEGRWVDTFEKEIQNIVPEVDSLSWWETDKVSEAQEK